jgi:hypothetical protein
MLHAASRNGVSGAVQPGFINECLLCRAASYRKVTQYGRRASPDRACQTAGPATMCRTALAAEPIRSELGQSDRSARIDLGAHWLNDRAWRNFRVTPPFAHRSHSSGVGDRNVSAVLRHSGFGGRRVGFAGVRRSSSDAEYGGLLKCSLPVGAVSGYCAAGEAK